MSGNGAIEWGGGERRAETESRRLHDLEVKVAMVHGEVHDQIRAVNAAVADLGTEVYGLRQDVHNMTQSVGSMRDSLAAIASTMQKLAEWPDTWDKIKGFWSIMRWLRDNILLIAMILGATVYIAYKMADNAKLLP